MIGFTPLADQYRVRQVDPATESEGGLALPQVAMHVTNEAVVLAVGPGALLPGTDVRTPMQAEEGDHVVYLLPDWSPTIDKEGVLSDDHLVGVVTGTGEIEPLNDWVKLTAPMIRTQTDGGLVVPEVWRKAEIRGVVLAVGPGKRRQAGPLMGTRKSVADILNWEEAGLLGATAWWSRQEENLSVTQPSGRPCMFVKADMLMAVEV